MKKTVMLFLVLLIAFSSVLNTESYAISVNDSSVFVKQSQSGRCTLASAVMLLRRRAIVDGLSNWNSITENAIAPICWCIDGVNGLKGTFSYSGMNVGMGTFYGDGSNNKSVLISLLSNHPEGIVGYNRDEYKKHAVLVTDYDASTDTFYCADPSTSSPNGRIPLTSAYLPGSTQAEKLVSFDSYWYITNKSGGSQITQPPSNAWIKSNYSSASSADNVMLSWGADYATTYWIHIYKDGQSFINESVGNSISFTRTYPEGNYTAYIEPANAYGKSPTVNVSFVISNSNPNMAIVSSERKVYSPDESVTLTWNSVSNANSYLIHIWTSKEDFLCQEVSGNSFTLSNLKDEMYTVYLTTYNSNGSTTSNPYDFWVTSNKPDKVTVTSSKDIYDSDESITITWNAVNNANSYLLHIWTSKEDYLCEEVVGNIYTLHNLENEMYTVYVTTYNPNGSTTSDPYDFWVGKYEINFINYDDTVFYSQLKRPCVDINLSTIIPERENYIFKGWNTEPDGSGILYNPGETYTDDNPLTLYAQWEECTAKLSTTVTKNKTSHLIKVTPENISQACDIIAVSYNNGKLVTVEAKRYSGNTLEFTASGAISEIKIMAWNSLSCPKPLCETEIINSREFISE